jgi:hypothetical protein
MQVIWSRLDAVDEGERLRIEARLESLTRQAPVTRVLIEGSPPDADAARETVRITGKVDGMQVVAIRDELNLGEALEYALRAFEESIARMSVRWAAREAEKKLEAVTPAPPPPAAIRGPSAAAAAPLAPPAAPAAARMRGPAPKVIELAPEQPSLGGRLREAVAGVLDGVLELLDRLPRRTPRFRKVSLGVSLVALVVALAAQRCGFDTDLTAAVAGGPRGFSAEAGAESESSGVSRSAPALRSFSARTPAPDGFSSSAEDAYADEQADQDAPAVPRFSAESENSGFAEDPEAEPAPELEEEELEDPSDPLADPETPERPGILRRRR